MLNHILHQTNSNLRLYRDQYTELHCSTTWLDIFIGLNQQSFALLRTLSPVFYTTLLG